MIKTAKYFNLNEFRCKHCKKLPKNGMNEVLIRKLDLFRERLGMPVIISSGYRCPVHNRNVGGVSNSQHVKGNAADLHANKSPHEMKKLALEIGFDGVGLYPWGVHVDCRDNGENPGKYQWRKGI